MKIFDIDGPFIQFLGKMADLMWLNILTIICCIPIITAGAALTALNYMVLKIVRDEESYITKGYFKAFKENFVQSTLIWLLFLVVAVVLAIDYRILTTTDVEINNIIQLLIALFGVLTLATFMFVFPVQAKFSNPVRVTIWNSFVFSVVQFPKTFLMVIFYAIPVVLIFVSMEIFPVVFVFGLSMPAFLSAKVYNKFFLMMEEQILAREAGENGADSAPEEEDEHIFSDEPIFGDDTDE